jgi:four helix bundle protein
MRNAQPIGVPVRDFEDLVCWQLSRALVSEVCAETARGPASRDFKFRDQIRDAAASAPRNIAEGFGRFSPADFARFLRYAVASLAETRNHLRDGEDRGYFTPVLASRLRNLAFAAERATKHLMLDRQRRAREARGRTPLQ